jgi:hypothetical protein
MKFRKDDIGKLIDYQLSLDFKEVCETSGVDPDFDFTDEVNMTREQRIAVHLWNKFAESRNLLHFFSMLDDENLQNFIDRINVDIKEDYVDLSKETIDRIIRESENEADFVMSLYKCVYKNWEEIEKVKGFPSISQQTTEYIIKEMDSKGFDFSIWINKGFSIDKDMGNFIVRKAPFITKKKK